ncbi:cytochrome P450 [Actinorhabdospora filicis]|uniref:Cytochrome P450 n=1 Tax=Actinorhabdospora filicis TaxID=1785913 RepID=A0A9W6ST76_9ACTN|nr:cytochrome P450 [Actinorhabdospora filicis]GLZ81628.1 cytochrome P450 [Actinorhabdospora filicis]
MSETTQTPPDYPFTAPTPVEPPPEWAELRQGCPVAHVRLPSGDEARLLTRYDDVRAMLSDPRFTRELTAPDAARLATTRGGVFEGASVIPASGPGHQRWRRLVGRWFTVRRMNELQPRIEAMAETLLDGMIKDGPPADMVAGLNFPLPVWVICEILGVPDGDRDRFSHWSSAGLNISKYTQEEVDTAAAEYAEYFAAHIAAKRAAPGDDLLSELITVVDAEDGRLSEPELIATGQGLLLAGHETTSNQLGKMFTQLLAVRERWSALLADPGLVRTTVEETLRMDALSGFGLPRYLTEDVEIGGETLPAGTTVISSLSSANRDESVFDGAGDVRLDRSPNTHMSFGVGPHSCIGQALARTELQSVLSVVLRRLPGLDLAVPLEELPLRKGVVVGGLEKLPVTW